MKKLTSLGLAGVVAATALTAGTVGGFIGSASSGTQELVAFDTIKYISARRAMTMQLLGSNEELKTEAVSVLARVDKHTMPLIEKYADGRVIIVKQALVVDSGVEDITDQVLTELGLSTNAITVAPANPDRPLTPFAASDDYKEAEEEHKYFSDAENKMDADREQMQLKAKKEQAEKEVQSWLP